ncbi:MAG: Fur family transcriptional regulator [Acidimicrobiales bacterium]
MPDSAPTSSPASAAEVLNLLRSHGGRVTRSRRVLLEVLFAASEHMNAEEIGAEVARVEPAVNMSTVYRNLEELQQLGVVVHTHLGHGPATYRLASAAHPHLYCESCGATFHLPLDIFEELSDTALRTHGFSVDATHFAIPGRCAACSKS